MGFIYILYKQCWNRNYSRPVRLAPLLHKDLSIAFLVVEGHNQALAVPEICSITGRISSTFPGELGGLQIVVY